MKRRIAILLVMTIAIMSMLVTTSALFAKTDKDRVKFDPTKHGTGLIQQKAKLPRIPCLKTKGVKVPASIDYSDKTPDVRDQGSQGSCLAFSSSTIKGYQEAKDWGWDVKNMDNLFSPAFIYNQANGGVDGGLTFNAASTVLYNQGDCKESYMPYNASDYTTQPDQAAKDNGANYKIKDPNFYGIYNTQTLKTWLATEGPAIMGIPVGDDFYYLYEGNDVYDEDPQTGMAHAITVIGYSDTKQAFKIRNSWGTSWGLSGDGWVSYALFDSICAQSRGVAAVCYDVISNDVTPTPTTASPTPTTASPTPTTASPTPTTQPPKPTPVPTKYKITFKSAKLIYNDHVGNQWSYGVRIGSKTAKCLKKGVTYTLTSKKCYVKVIEDDGATKYDDIAESLTNLKKGDNKIIIYVKENSGKYKGHLAKWQFIVNLK